MNHSPTFEQHLANLRTGGEQFPASQRTISTIGAAGLNADMPVLRQIGQLYTADTAVQEALNSAGLHVGPAQAAVSRLERAMDNGLVWGFSGYASEGPSYDAEADGLQQLHQELADMGERPAMTLDGGCSAGVLGLNGLLAAQRGIHTFGIIPRKGLDSVGVRNDMLVAGAGYRDREVFVGTLPDVLVCVGGAAGTERECQTALRTGSTVLLLMLRDYPANSLATTYRNLPETPQALAEKRLVVCDDPEAIGESAERIVTSADRTAQTGRESRIQTVRSLL